MENKKNLESKIENPCKERFVGDEPDYLCNLNGKCVDNNVYSGLGEGNRGLELGREMGYGSFDDNRINYGDVDSLFDDKLLGFTDGNDMDSNDVLDLEKDLNFDWNDEIGVGMAEEEPLDKSDDLLSSHALRFEEPLDTHDDLLSSHGLTFVDPLDTRDDLLSSHGLTFVDSMEENEPVLHPHQPSSPTKIEVSGSGINIFVEVFGPLDGISDGDNNVSGNGILSPFGGEHVNVKNEGDIVGEGQCKFDVDDLVWVKTRTPLWWPGMIFDPSNVAKDEIKSEKRGTFLVKYFGNSNFVWCPDKEMKPFLEFFESMSRQNNSRNFIVSVEKALCEFGQRVKSKMICPCFSTKSHKEDNSMLVSQFEPVNFYARIKNLARSVSVPGKIELTLAKNHLSAFYWSLGHLELPLQSLRSSTDDGDDDKITTPSKSFECRERKKSKYLSFPYIDAIVEPAAEDPKDPKDISSQPTKPTPQKSSGKKSQKKGAAKPSKSRHVISKADNIDACSSELLDELRSTARDCLYLRGSMYSDSLRTFYHSFRTFAFLEADIACKVVVAHQAQKREKMEGVGMTQESSNIRSSNIDNLQEATKKTEPVISAVPDSISNTSVTGLNVTTNDSGMISFQQAGSGEQKSVKALKKREVGPTPMLPHIETVATLSDIDGNPANISFGHMPVREPSSNVNGIHQMDFGSVSSLHDVQVGLTCEFPNTEVTTGVAEANVIKNGIGPSIQNPVQMGPFPSAGKPERKKRNTKESTYQVDKTIPDLNGKILENLPEGNYLLTPVGKPELKSMRNKSADTETGATAKRTRVFNKVEDPGGRLLLNFAQDSTLPAKETLVKTFSRFGLLKESEIQVLDELTVQIVYERSSDAQFAARSLDKSKPFGESLVGFKLDGVPAFAPRPKKKRKFTQQTAAPAAPVDATKNVPRPVEKPDIALMRQNVEMMKMTLEKAGNNLSADMRGLLENEIKVFLDKISAMAGSSSS